MNLLLMIFSVLSYFVSYLKNGKLVHAAALKQSGFAMLRVLSEGDSSISSRYFCLLSMSVPPSFRGLKSLIGVILTKLEKKCEP